MRIKSMRVENFRSVRSATLKLDGLTALVGANGAGKSTFLHALLVFQDKQKVDAEDFYNRDTARDIEIAVTFTGLSEAAKKKFAKYTQNGELEVIRVCRHSDNGTIASTLHGSSPRNPAFAAARSAGTAPEALREYKKLRESGEYDALPPCTSRKGAREELDRWEDDNAGKCERSTDDGRFFGFSEVGEGYLGRFIRILYVPAVRDASGDGTEGGRGSVLRELVELAVKNTLSESNRYKELQEAANAVYEKARDVKDLPEVKLLEKDINGTLGMFARGARVGLKWSLQAPSVGLPTATVQLEEDGYATTIDRTGHGLQRAFIIAMLSRLHGARAAKAKPAGDGVGDNNGGGGGGGDGDGSPSIVLAIEEPELYQHPTRARHIAGLLSSISKDGFEGVAPNVQVIYATHSPYFVGADRIGQIRLLRKADGEKGMPKATCVWSTSTSEIQKRLTGAGAAKHADPDKLEHDFDRVLTPLMSEGFFAGTAVLVEGDSDRIAITRAAELLGTPLDEQGVVVIPCGSKSALPGPLVMFRELGVRTYVVWDGDNDKQPEKKRNRRLLSLLGLDEGEIAGGGWLGDTNDKFACCESNMDCMLRSDMGEDTYAPLAARIRSTYRLRGPNDKKPLVAHLVAREMKKRNILPERLGRVVNAILAGGASAAGARPAADALPGGAAGGQNPA